MSAEDKVYQITYLDGGKRAIIGDEILTMTGATKYTCGQCHGRLISKWLEVEGSDQHWWIVCPTCGPVSWVSRYYRAMRSDGGFQPARLGGSNYKADAELMREVGHHSAPFESVAAAEAALELERQAVANVADVLAIVRQLEESDAR